jgi:tetratricopeptide (TPR) repeat protein
MRVPGKLRLAAIFLFCLALCYGATTGAAPGVEQLLSKARSLEGRGRLDLAARAWEQVLLVDDSNQEALTGLARFAKQSGKGEDASRYLNRLRKMDPSNPAIARVESMSSMGEQRTRLEEAQRLAQKHQFEGAMRIYRQVFGNEPPAGGRAIAYFETEAANKGGWQDATAGLTRLVQMYPDAEEYRLALGKLLTYRERSRAQGLDLLESIKNRSELVESARQAWRQALLWDSGTAASAGSLASYLARYPDPEVAGLQPREKKEPATSAEKAQAPGKPLQSAEEGLGYKALGAGKLGDAEQHFTAALKTSPRKASALSGLGFVRMKEERFVDAVSYFESALNSEPKNKTITDALATAKFWQHMKAGADYLNADATTDAVSEFRAAVALRPESVEALEALAGSYLKQQRPDLACPIYQKLVTAKTENPDTWYGLIKSHYDLGRAAEALRLLKTAPSSIRDQWTSNPERLVMISFLYADSGDQTQAQRVLLRARQLSGGRAADLSPDLQMQFAGLYLRLDRPRQAAEAFSQLTRVQPNRVEAWEGLLNSLLRLSDTSRAYQTLHEIPSATYKEALTRASFTRTVRRSARSYAKVRSVGGFSS